MHNSTRFVWPVMLLTCGSLGLISDILKVRAKKWTGAYADWRELFLSLFFLADGIVRLSEAFDTTRASSPRTHLIELLFLPFMFLLIAVNSVLLIKDRRERKRGSDATQTEKAEVQWKP